MKSNTESNLLNNTQKVLLTFSCILLSLILFLLRGGFDSQSPFEQIARKSMLPDVALTNGRPTVFEFYADWCEACKEMAPTMVELESINKAKINFVFLNVDNNRWEDLLETYEVNGIPQLNFFDNQGKEYGTSIGVRTKDQLEDLLNSLILNKPFANFPGIVQPEMSLLTDRTFNQNGLNATNKGPRAHS